MILTGGVIILTLALVAAVFTSAALVSYASTTQPTNSQPVNGVVMKGAIVNMKQDDDGSPKAPQDYIEDSFKEISGAGLDHARFLFYWEAYERDPEAFMKEIQSVAETADKYKVKIIYDNHQWHTSSWLEDRGTGFPWSLFQGNSKYSKGGGGNTVNKAAQVFWSDWWDRSVKDKQGKDGWKLMSEFLRKIVSTVDNHPSTLGYEILSEPHVDDKDQWSKIGQFNSFITTELRNITSKTIVYSMNVPVDLNGPIDISPENLAKMAPINKENIAFKISVYGVPNRDAYQKDRFDLFLKTRDLTGVPLYIGEWNNVVRTKQGGVFKINSGSSQFTETNAEKILGTLKKAGVWGTAFWKWDYRDADTDSFNLVSDSNGKLEPTKYFDILKDTVETVYGSSNLVSEAPKTSDAVSSSDKVKESNLINELVKTGKFTVDEAIEFVTKTTQNSADSISTSDAQLTSNTGIDTTSSLVSGNTQLSNIQDNTNDQPSNSNMNSPEEYDDLAKLVHDIKNHKIDTDDVPLNSFKNSGAYQEANEQTQACINLAAKIGKNLIDYEIVRCSEDANYFKNQISNNNDNNNANGNSDNNDDTAT